MYKKKYLPDVTLLGIDCINVDRLIRVSRICQKHIKFGDVKLLTSIPSSSPGVVYIDHLGTIEDYSRFMIKDLYSYIETAFVLIIQHDGFILNPTAWDDQFLQYDYIGAPWAKATMSVGNGGFSLRSKRLMELLAREINLTEYYPEDGIICRVYRDYLERKGITFASEALAQKFSFEANHKFGLAWNGQFGFHSYCSNLRKWNPFNYADLLADIRFLVDFVRQARSRYRVKIDHAVTAKMNGQYSGIEKTQDEIKILSNDSKLIISNAWFKNVTFYPFDERTYFSDKINAVIKFNKVDQNNSIRLSFLDLSTSTLRRYEKKISPGEFQEIVSLYQKAYSLKKNSFGGFENI